MIKMIEESFDVSVQYIVGWLVLYHLVEHSQRLMTAPARSESHHFIIEHWFKDCFQYAPQGILYQLILVAVDAEGSGFAVIFGNLDSSCRFRSICLSFSALQPDHQDWRPDVFRIHLW